MIHTLHNIYTIHAILKKKEKKRITPTIHCFGSSDSSPLKKKRQNNKLTNPKNPNPPKKQTNKQTNKTKHTHPNTPSTYILPNFPAIRINKWCIPMPT